MRNKLCRVGTNERGETRYVFYCPACKHGHFFTTPPSILSGSLKRPTVRPEIVSTTRQSYCASWLKNGQISFSQGSTHQLAGQSVPIPDWED